MKNDVLMFENQAFVTEKQLRDEGVDPDLLYLKQPSFDNNDESEYFFRSIKIGDKKLFFADSIPHWIVNHTKFPKTNKRLIASTIAEHEANKERELATILFTLKSAWNVEKFWKQFKPNYVDYYFDPEISNLFCKTESLFNEVLSLKKSYSIGRIFLAYKTFEKAVFFTENLKSFYRKIKHAEDVGVRNALIHTHKLEGRDPYKLSGFIQTKIKEFYCSPKRDSNNEILRKVNLELLDRGLKEIKLSTVQRFLADPEVRNTCDPIRYGIEYADEFINPFILRAEPMFGDLLEIDCTRVPIPFKNNALEAQYLWICAIMEVHSRRIIGFSFSHSENIIMILSALKMALTNLGITPRQILHDNHKAYYSAEFKSFSNKGFDMGIDFRAARIGNHKDKSHIERWMGTYQTKYLKPIFGSMGEGIKTKRKGGRVNEKQRTQFSKLKNLRSEEVLKKVLLKCIARYNADVFSKFKTSPNERFAKAKL